MAWRSHLAPASPKPCSGRKPPRWRWKAWRTNGGAIFAAPAFSSKVCQLRTGETPSGRAKKQGEIRVAEITIGSYLADTERRKVSLPKQVRYRAAPIGMIFDRTSEYFTARSVPEISRLPRKTVSVTADDLRDVLDVQQRKE